MGISQRVYDEATEQQARPVKRDIPTGVWRGVLTRWNVKDESTKYQDWQKGRELYGVSITFHDCPTLGQTSYYWFDLTPEEVRSESGKLRMEVTALAALYKLFGFPVDTPVEDVLNRAQGVELQWDIWQSPPSATGKQRSRIRTVSQ